MLKPELWAININNATTRTSWIFITDFIVEIL